MQRRCGATVGLRLGARFDAARGLAMTKHILLIPRFREGDPKGHESNHSRHGCGLD